MHNAIDQGVSLMNVSDEKDVQIPQMPNSLER